MNRKKIISMLLGAVVYLNITISSSFLLAQTGQSATATANATENQEADVIKCWWRSDKSMVRVGENFLLILTCQIVESNDVKVILNENSFESSTIPLAPYKVIEGIKHQDIYKGAFKFIQYQYLLNIIEEDYFGKDTPVPSLEINYKVERKMTQLESINTKDRVYKMPELSMKIHSLISKNTNDIRDSGNETFGQTEDRRLRAKLSFILAGILFVVPAAAIFFFLIRASYQLKKKGFNGTLFSPSKLLDQLLIELKKIKQARNASDWENELTGRVVAIFRIVGAIGLSRNISQVSVLFETRGLEGQIKLKKGLFRPTKILICSSLTPETMKESINDGPSPSWNVEFLKVFEIFNHARYSVDSIDAQELDPALVRGIELVQKLSSNLKSRSIK